MELNLNNIFHGQSEAPPFWYKKWDFKNLQNSEAVICLFIPQKMICIVYTNKVLLCYQYQSYIDEFKR